jgi:DNA-binding beta-propeller fold protein YncE
MRFPKALAALAGLAVLAAGCSSGASSVPATTNGSMSFSQKAQLMRSGIDPKLATVRSHHGVVTPMAKAGFSLLAVTDDDLNEVLLFNKSYSQTGTISNGIDGPDGNWIDSKGNQYVAQFGALNVVEYTKTGAQKNSAPKYTYSSGLTDPVGVTTDTSGNVYVADYGDGSASVVVEFPQGKNTASNSCSTGLANEGIVVDSSGNVFASGNNPNTGEGNLIEFKGGLKGCKATTLGVTFTFAGGLQMDKKGNLAACDQDVGLDIIPSPYNSVKSTITGPIDTFHDALTKNNKMVFIADPSSGEVFGYTYPKGKLTETLGSSQGIEYPLGVGPGQLGEHDVGGGLQVQAHAS